MTTFTHAKLYAEDVNVGDEIPGLTRGPVTHLQLVCYVGPLALRKFGVHFKGMTHLNDVITCTGKIIENVEVDGEVRITGNVQAADQHGDVKVSDTFVAALPRLNA